MYKPSSQFGDSVMRLLIILILFTICLTAPGQTFDTQSRYIDSAGKGMLIQSSFPKGMAPLDSTNKTGYTDATGKYFAYVVFWTRVTNQTTTPLELTVNFPAGFPSPYSYLKLFLPPDTMTLDKESLINYGVRGLKSFLDSNFNKPTLLQRTIHPNGECLFYIAVLSSKPGKGLRAQLVLKENDLFYNIRGIGPELDSAFIPCGQIVFKN